MTETSCTGCKIFSMCLGSPDMLLQDNSTYQCYYCGMFYVGKTNFHGTTCLEMYEHAYGGARDRNVVPYVACSDRVCKAKQNRDWKWQKRELTE